MPSTTLPDFNGKIWKAAESRRTPCFVRTDATANTRPDTPPRRVGYDSAGVISPSYERCTVEAPENTTPGGRGQSRSLGVVGFAVARHSRYGRLARAAVAGADVTASSKEETVSTTSVQPLDASIILFGDQASRSTTRIEALP